MKNRYFIYLLPWWLISPKLWKVCCVETNENVDNVKIKSCKNKEVYTKLGNLDLAMRKAMQNAYHCPVPIDVSIK